MVKMNKNEDLIKKAKQFKNHIKKMISIANDGINDEIDLDHTINEADQEIEFFEKKVK